MERAADLLLVNGQVLTMDPTLSVQDALAIRATTILAVGRSRDLRTLAGPRTRIIDLRGRSVIPGAVDAHAHMDREGLRHACRTWQAPGPSRTSWRSSGEKPGAGRPASGWSRCRSALLRRTPMSPRGSRIDDTRLAGGA